MRQMNLLYVQGGEGSLELRVCPGQTVSKIGVHSLYQIGYFGVRGTQWLRSLV